MFDVFEGSFEVVCKLEGSSARPGIEYKSRFYWRFPSCCRVESFISLLFYGGVLGIVLVTWFPYDKGAQQFLEGLLRLSEVSQEVLSLPYVHGFP